MPADVVIWKAPGNPFAGADYADRLEELLFKAGYSPRVYDYFNDNPDDRTTECARHILSGGEVAVNDPSPSNRAALERVGALFKMACSQEVRIAGVCLGSQQLAAFIGGKRMVERSTRGIHIGYERIRSVSTDFSSITACRFHYEQISPDLLGIDGVRPIFEDEHVKVQGFSFGPAISAVQFHPEFSPDDARHLFSENTALTERFGTSEPNADKQSAKLAGEWSADDMAALLHRMLG